MLLKTLLRRLDLTTLQLFLAVHEEGTLTRAAEREAIATGWRRGGRRTWWCSMQTAITTRCGGRSSRCCRFARGA